MSLGCVKRDVFVFFWGEVGDDGKMVFFGYFCDVFLAVGVLLNILWCIMCCSAMCCSAMCSSGVAWFLRNAFKVLFASVLRAGLLRTMF